MKKKFLFSLMFLFFFLFLARGGWLPTDIRLDTGDMPGASVSWNPQISNSGSNVYVVWEDHRNFLSDIYFNYSTNGGTTWQAAAVRLDTDDTPGYGHSDNPQISSSGSNVYVVWRDYRNKAEDIYFNYSNDGGASWQAMDIRLDTGDAPGASISNDPQISSIGNNVYVVWEDRRNGGVDIYFNNSTDGGATWQSTDIRLNTGVPPGTGSTDSLQISCNGNNVYVVWHDWRNVKSDIYFNYSKDSGATWQASDIRLDTGDPLGANWSHYPQISSSGSNVYVVWKDNRNAGQGIYFNYSTDSGATWQATALRLDTGNPPGEYNTFYPQINSNGSNVYIAWSDYRSSDYTDIYFNYSTDSGVTWQVSDIRLDTGDLPSTNHSFVPQISCSDSSVYVVWFDYRNGEGDIYFNCSIDGGMTWMTPDARLDTGDIPGSHRSSRQQIGCSDNAVYVVWEDERNGDEDIYFNTASIPSPDIKANGSDGPITITQGDALLVTIDFDAGIQTGEDADWWVLMKTSDPKPNNWYYFDMPTRSWMLGRSTTRQGSLFDITSKKVPKTSGLTPGTYVFYFAVDMVMNGSIDVSQAYYDKVKVTINP